MTKEEIKEIIREVIKEELSVAIESHSSMDYETKYTGVAVKLKLNDVVISNDRDSF